MWLENDRLNPQPRPIIRDRQKNSQKQTLV